MGIALRVVNNLAEIAHAPSAHFESSAAIILIACFFTFILGDVACANDCESLAYKIPFLVTSDWLR